MKGKDYNLEFFEFFNMGTNTDCTECGSGDPPVNFTKG